MARCRLAIALLAFACLSIGLAADSWRPPTREKYYSPNRKIRLEVVPRALESQLKFFQDRVEGREPAGAPSRALASGPRASLSVRQFLWYREHSSFPLVNDVAPVDVLVSNAGDYVVTLDDWHGLGYGDSVAVIYRADGHVIRRFALTDLIVESDVEHFERSVSSIHWREGYRLDPAAGDLVLTLRSSQMDLPGQWPRMQEIRVELATGMLREPTRRLWPRREAVVLASAASDEEFQTNVDAAMCAHAQPTFETPGNMALASLRLFEMATSRPSPEYPLIARAARVAGTVVVEVLVAEGGAVQCVRALSGPPLLRPVAVDAARRWTFAPQAESPSRGLTGRIEFRFGTQWK